MRPLSLIWRHRLLVAVLGVAAYWPSLRTGFIWDDRFLILENSNLASWRSAPSDFTRPIFANPSNTFYRPLLPFSLRFDYSLFRREPLGYHVTNLLLHLGNSLLVLEVALCLGVAPLAALFTGVLFAVHPIIVQNLLMIVGRDELLSLFFGLASALMLLRPSARALGAGLFLFAGSSLAKESGVSALVYFMILGWNRIPKTMFWRRVAAMTVITIAYGAVHHAIIPDVLPPFDPVWLAAFLVKGIPIIVWRYAALIFWPWPLYTDRMAVLPGPWWPVFTFSLVLVAGIMLWKRSRIGLACMAWFIAGLAPKLVKTLTSSMTLDHWAYPSLVGALVPLGLLFAEGWSHGRPAIRQFARISLVTIIIFWITLVHVNIRLRGTHELFFAWSARYPTSPTILSNHAAILISQGRCREAARLVDRITPESAHRAGIEAALKTCSPGAPPR